MARALFAIPSLISPFFFLGQRAPFVVGVVFDGGEVFADDEDLVSKGFSLDWIQDNDCTP